MAWSRKAGKNAVVRGLQNEGVARRRSAHRGATLTPTIVLDFRGGWYDSDAWIPAERMNFRPSRCAPKYDAGTQPRGAHRNWGLRTTPA